MPKERRGEGRKLILQEKGRQALLEELEFARNEKGACMLGRGAQAQSLDLHCIKVGGGLGNDQECDDQPPETGKVTC